MSSPVLMALLLCCLCMLPGLSVGANTNHQRPPIDRKALIERHNVKITSFDSLSALTLGNGSFAMTVDATGLQTFPELYERGIPLGTFSDWGWHRFPNPEGFTFEETLQSYSVAGRQIPLPVNDRSRLSERGAAAAEWFRQNPHRLHLGILGFELITEKGEIARSSNLTGLHQQLDLWSGEIHSQFMLDGVPVDVVTCCHPHRDLVAVRISSPALSSHRIRLVLRFPYPTGKHTDGACDWNAVEKHETNLQHRPSGAAIFRVVDSTQYFVAVCSPQRLHIKKRGRHEIMLELEGQGRTLELSTQFSAGASSKQICGFSETRAASHTYWLSFWSHGGAVDLSGSTDSRAFELERRLILSQYLTAIQCAGRLPPQETGLTYNSWYGRIHLEMHWWHGVHFALWNRIDLLERSLAWYASILPQAIRIAQRQGFEGARWPKMTDPSGGEAPSSIGSFLVWQQPHIIYFAELCYRDHRSRQTLQRYQGLVAASADFMASFALFDSTHGRYILKGVMPAQERFEAESTWNPSMDLVYWAWGLRTALTWCDRLGIPRNPKWEKVLTGLSSLPRKDGVYLAAESASDSYVNPQYLSDHPAVLGAFGMLNGAGMVDTTVMKNTFHLVWERWRWQEKTWGWDFPFVAMTAVRLGEPRKAIDALFMDIPTNRYLINGHNYRDGILRLYLPGNGGLLSAVAMMCAGCDGLTEQTPGFPDDGTWRVRWENLRPMP
jgi:protein-glucosylgalactosylhydroxylysine glucosidase